MFLKEYEGLDITLVKAEWINDLSKYSMEQVAYAFETCKDKEYPPTLPTFVSYCKATPRNVEPLRLGRKFTPEEIAANKARLKDMLGMLAAKKVVSEGDM